MSDNPSPAASVSPPDNTIVLGDTLATMNAWPEACVDLVFADPPYNIGFKYDKYEDNLDDDQYVRWTQDWISACARILKPSGSFYILIGDEYAAEARMHLKALERQRKLHLRNWIIWHYTFGQNCRGKFNRSHAHLLYCVGAGVYSASKRVKGGLESTTPHNRPYAFNREAIAVPSARQTTYGDLRANPTGKNPDDVWYLRPQQAADAGDSLFNPDLDTWALSRLCGTFGERVAWHPCQLPEALLERIIRVSSHEGDLVFDPFAGSGTTLAVAARLKRRWLGCELSEDYASRATERVLHAAATGTTMVSTQAAKGISEATRKKKPEPYRSLPSQVSRSPDNQPLLSFDAAAKA